MTELPEPLTPPGCDLRAYSWMPLEIRRLLTSETWICGTAEAKVAAVNLWSESWHQVPAGSLPDHDVLLAHLSQAGPRWAKVRDWALRGWIKCSDGRLYHPVVAANARAAWEAGQAQRRRTEAAREAKRQKHADGAVKATPSPVTTSVTEPVTEIATGPVAEIVATPSQAPEYRRGKEKREDTLPSVGAAEPPSAPAGARGTVREEGVMVLRRLTGTSDRQARAILGRLVRDAGDDCAAVLAVLREAEDLHPVDPVPWMLRAVQARGTYGSTSGVPLGTTRDPPARREGTSERIRREMGAPSILDALDELNRPFEPPGTLQ